MPIAAAADMVADEMGFERVSRKPNSRAAPPVPSVMVAPVDPALFAVTTRRPAVPPSLTMVAVTPAFASLILVRISSRVSVAATAMDVPLTAKSPVIPRAAVVSAIERPASLAVSASWRTSTRERPAVALDVAVADNSVRDVDGLVGTDAEKPPKPVRRSARALVFSVSTSFCNFVHASFCLPRVVIRSVIGVTERASRALMVVSTRSFHCTPLLRPPMLTVPAMVPTLLSHLVRLLPGTGSNAGPGDTHFRSDQD